MKNKTLRYIIYILIIGLTVVLCYFYHNDIRFMMDDLWYSTNLKTGEPLSSIKDVFEGQLWHYRNWGGRSVTHTLLQFILMGGETFADILNVFTQLLLALISTLFISKKSDKLFSFAFVLVAMLAFNPNITDSMFWQSGAVNYLYSTCWILVYMFIFLRELNPDSKPLWGITFWSIPLAVFTGWSNENMGPAAFCLGLMVIFILLKEKRKPKGWMIVATMAAFLGSALCILAPGNFVRSEFSEGGSLTDTLINRFTQMFTAGLSFLAPSFLLLLLLLIIVKVLNIKPQSKEIILLITAVLAYGAMALSPHFPDRATFGIMLINIILSAEQISKIKNIYPDFGKFFDLLLYSVSLYSIIDLTIKISAYR